MLVRIAVSTFTCLIAVLSGLPGQASADPGDGVGVFHDRVVKRDPAGDVSGDGTTPIDIRRVTYDHYKTGDRERLVVTVRFADFVREGSELNGAPRPAPEATPSGSSRGWAGNSRSNATTASSGAPTSAVPSRETG